MPFRPMRGRCWPSASASYARTFAILAVFGVGLLTPATAVAQDEEVVVTDESGYDAGAEGRTAFDEAVSRIRGELRLDFRWEWVTASNDQGNLQNNPQAAFTVSPSRHKRDADLFGYLSLYSQGLGHEALDLKFSGRYEHDLRGDPQRYEFNDFRDDRNGQRASFRIRELYGRVRVLGQKSALVDSTSSVDITAGRFYFHELGQYYNLLWGRVNGGMIRWDHLFGRISGQFFGGARDSDYDGRRWKRLLGGHLTFHALDDRLALTVSDVLHIDNVLTGTVEFEPVDWLLLVSQVNFVENDLDSLRVFADIDVPGAFFNLFFYYRSVFDNSDKFDYDYTDSDNRDATGARRFSRRRLQFTQEPGLDEYEMKIYKGFGVGDGVFGIFAQARRKEIRSDSKRDEYNFDFWEGTVGFDIHDLPFDGFFFEARLNYVDPDHPAFGSNTGNFDDIRGEGETYWIEVYTHARVSLFYYRLTLGAEFWYREFEYRTRFVRLEDLKQQGAGAYMLVKITENLRFRADYFYENAFEIVDQDIEYHQRLQLSIRFSF